jgi:predicted nucleic acid-binding Zn ribbon protein
VGCDVSEPERGQPGPETGPRTGRSAAGGKSAAGGRSNTGRRPGAGGQDGAARPDGPQPDRRDPAPRATGAAGGSPDLPDGLAGPELARAVLDAAQAKRRAAPRKPRPATGSGRRLRGYSGPGPDPRDPQLFGALLERLVRNRGWQKPAAEATVFGDWAKVVGAEIAEHCRPVKLEDGVLTVEAESTAWATQLRLLSGRLLATIAGQVGNNVVRSLHIHGPAAPSWSRGPRRVRGRGPRDTYG